MQRLLNKILRLGSGQDSAGPQIHLNRMAQRGNPDPALAAFKADQMRIARRARQAAEDRQARA